MLSRPTMGYRVGNHSRVHMKNFPVQINSDCALSFLKIKKELTEALSSIASFSKETPQKGRSTRKSDKIAIQLHKGKDFFLSVKIYIAGCNVFWLININAKERDTELKGRIVDRIKKLRIEKGYSA